VIKTDAAACELAEEVIRRFGSVRLRVQGTSMMPAIRPGDTIEVERTHPREIAPGEIVLYTRDGRFFAHRVTRRSQTAQGTQLVTQGDRLQAPDAPITARELLGRVAFIERGRRRVPPRVRIGAMERAVGRVLRLSDRATGLYLRLIPS
jgi:signal peptidase I